MDFFTFFVLVCLTVLLVYARRIEKRRRRDAEKYEQTAAALTARIHALEQQSKMPWAHPEAADVTKATSSPATIAPQPKPAASFLVGGAQPGKKSVPSEPPQIPMPPKVKDIGGIPLTPPTPAKEVSHPPIAAAASASAAQPPAIPQPTSETSVNWRTPLTGALAGGIAQASATRHAASPAKPVQPFAMPVQQQSVPFSSATFAAAPKKRSISLEEMVGTNWLPKLGVTILVLAVVLFTATRWEHMSAIWRVILFYVLGASLLSGGIFLERKEKYQILGRVLIGGGWSVLFFITFAMQYVPQAKVLDSNTVDLVLLLAVASAMVWHTLRYNSQTITGFAFFLGFLSVTISHNTSLSLVAGAILAMGLTVIVLRRQWYELEVFGILASYLNHFYWLYEIFNQNGHRQFPEYPASVVLVSAYWAIFRTSYLARKTSSAEHEAVSTVAALLNPLMFLGVMKYQSFHPEWAFYVLLTMGAIEFALGQLPVSHRRKAPFQILSCLGATLMVVAIPFKYSGTHSLELLWMAGAEAFLLAGIFTRERLFRQFSGIISLLVAGYLFAWPPNGIIYEFGRIVGRQPHHDASLSLVLATVAALFYINSHVIARIWEGLFDEEIDQQAINTFSFIASLFAVGAIYASVANNAVAVVLAILVTALAWTGRRFRISQLMYQAHWIAAVAIVDVCSNAVHLDAAWHSIPERFITFGLVAGLLYLSSNFVGLSLAVILYRWAGTGLIALAVWMQIWYAPVRRDWVIAMLWTAFALVLSGVARLLKRGEFKWQAFCLAMMSFCCALVVNFNFAEQFHHLSYRLISVTLVAGGIYVLSRWAPIPQVRPAYSWAGTILLGYLVFRETQEHQELWTAVLWTGMATVLGLAARFWKDRALLWQTHLLAATATAWTIGITFLGDTYRGTRGQLISVLLTSALLYALTWITKIPEVIESDRIWQGYSWAGSLLLTWLAWYQLQPINVSMAWGVFAVVLFEIGDVLETRFAVSCSYLRAQTYVALACSFAHLFYSNFNTPLAPGTFDPHILLIMLLVPIYFWVYWRLHERTVSGNTEKKLKVEYLLACMGTATVAALARFEMSSESVVVGYGAIVLALVITAWLTRLPIFLYQTLAMLGVAAFRLAMHNFRNFHSSFVSSLPSAIWTIVLLAAGIPFAFRLRSKDGTSQVTQKWILYLVRRPEQPLFFVSSILLAVLLALKMHATMITLSWCVEGITMILAGFFAQERSFRLSGLALFLLSAAKVFVVDLRAVSDLGVRYLAMGGVGAVMVAAGYVFSRNREALRKYL